MNEKLKSLRLEYGLTQKELAKQINSTDKNIWAYENKIATPPVEILIAYAKFFDVTTDYLLGISDDFGVKKTAPAPVQKSEDYSNEETKLIEDYRALNPMNKKLIKQTMSALRSSAVATDERQKNKNQN